MNPIGLLIVLATLTLPAPWFASLAGQHDPIAVFSQYIGATALIAMGWSQLLATRLPGLEPVFGGLDRIYVLHKWLGIGALGAVLLHDTIDADIDGIGRETALVDLAETLGELSLYGFLALVIITIATFVPYHLWRWTHRLMGAFFALSAFHFAFILKPFPISDPLGMYILGFCAVGILAYLYTLVPFGWLQGRRAYTVSAIQRTGDALAVSLTPDGHGLRHRAGQFAFVRFDGASLGEVHPFTISSAPDSGNALRFTIKPLGDYTSRLEKGLEAGMKAQVSGPFGHFARPRGRRTRVWIAGGIGVTPFVAWAGDLGPDEPEAHLFLCARDRASAPHVDELEQLAATKPNLHLHVIESARRRRLDADEIAGAVGVPLAQTSIAFCGPKPMRESLQAALRADGVPASRFAYEEFEIRSGIGLRRLASWLLARTVPGSLRPVEAARQG